MEIDPNRINYNCGIPIRAKLNDKYGVYDLAQLDRNSLIEWLGRDLTLTTNTIMALFDHERVTFKELSNMVVSIEKVNTDGE